MSSYDSFRRAIEKVQAAARVIRGLNWTKNEKSHYMQGYCEAVAALTGVSARELIMSYRDGL